MTREEKKKKQGLAGNCVFVGVCAIVSSEYKHTDIRSVGKTRFQGAMCQAAMAIFKKKSVTYFVDWIPEVLAVLDIPKSAFHLESFVF